MKRILILTLALFCTIPLSAQRKRVGLVLSGGGAKGVAHIGAIKVLEEAGIPIDYIVGTSMGAIVGGLYSIGYDTKTLDSLVKTQDWGELFSERVSRENMSLKLKEQDNKYLINLPLNRKKRLELPIGIMGGNNVYNFLSTLTVGYNDSIAFNTLPIPFACVAYDIVQGKDAVMESGYLPQAIRASMSIPGVFEPVRTGDKVLIDGGISNNFPVDVVRQMGAEVVIGIDVGAGMKSKEQINTVIDIFDQLTTITGLEAATRNKANTDLYIHPDITSYGAASFNPAAIDTLVTRGEKAARDRWSDILALKEQIGLEPTQVNPNTRQPFVLNRPLCIGQIEVESDQEIDPRAEALIRKSIDINSGDTIKAQDIRTAVSKIQGIGRFTKVTSRLDGNNAPYTLIFNVTPQSINTVGLGVRFDTEGKAALLLNGTISTNAIHGSTFDLTARLSQNPYVRLGYELGGAASHKLGFSYKYGDNNNNLYKNAKRLGNIDFDYHGVTLQLSNIQMRNFSSNIGICYEYFNYQSLLLQNTGGPQMTPKGYINYFVNVHLETLDALYYPTRGLVFNAGYTFTTDNFLGLNGKGPLSAVTANFAAPISLTDRLVIIPSAYGRTVLGNSDAFPYLNFMGGVEAGRYVDQQLPFIGINNIEIFDNALLVGRLDIRMRMWLKHYISLMGNVARESPEIGDIFRKGNNIWGGGIKYSYSTAVGPIDLIFSSSTLSRKLGVYFNFGYYF